jgi:two-component system nitrogen regulation response regulator GlnG/two-component system response regulator HydG
MPDLTTVLPVESGVLSSRAGDGGEATVVVLAWSAEEPWRVGEIAMSAPIGQSEVFGRGDGEPGEARVRFGRQRPGTYAPGPPLQGEGVSRRQLVITSKEDGLVIDSVGQCELRVNGVRTSAAVIRPGDTIYLRRQLLLLCTRRPAFIPEGRFLPQTAWGEFGEPDAFGILGESPATWHLREQLAFVGKSNKHVLLVGASGSGKELAARAIHAMSSRAPKPFAARNAATLPAGLIDAELFGSARNYPNAGMPERPGLIGSVDGGTLFLDEIAELPLEQQAHLLRVLDARGEYTRLGESTPRRADFRLVGATNRDPSTLKHDLAARLTSIIELLPLASRREDIPLLARHLLFAAARESPDVAERFVGRDGSGRTFARFTPGFIDCALRQDLKNNTRQLEALLWKAMSQSTQSYVEPPNEWRRETSSAPPGAAVSASSRPSSSEPSADQIRDALGAVGGSIGKAASILGLSNRFALYRLMKKHGISDKNPE